MKNSSVFPPNHLILEVNWQFPWSFLKQKLITVLNLLRDEEGQKQLQVISYFLGLGEQRGSLTPGILPASPVGPDAHVSVCQHSRHNNQNFPTDI